jgi:hypothetical protein
MNYLLIGMGCIRNKQIPRHLMDLPRQDMLIYHPEFQVIKIIYSEFQTAADARNKGDPHFVEFEQRNSYFVLPMIEKLKKISYCLEDR